jgi:large subunit ribosomal protein L24
MSGLKIKKGDRVRVLQGKDRGKEGEVTRAFPSDGKVIDDGVNIVKRHQRATRATMQGGIIDKHLPIDVSTVARVCPSCGTPPRVGYRFDDQGRKSRVCKHCGGDIA